MTQNKIIEEITPEMEAQVPFYMEKWRKLVSNPIDREKATELLKGIYPLEYEPPVVIFAESFESFVRMVKDGWEKAESEHGAKYRGQIPSLRYAIDFHEFCSKLGLQLRSRLRLFGLRAYSQIMRLLHSKLESELYQLFRAEFANSLRARDSFESFVLYLFYDHARYFDYGEMLGANFDGYERDRYVGILLNAPIMFFVSNKIFICEKPQVSWHHNVFHSDVKPAVGWLDGTGYYYLHGVPFEKDFWKKVVSGKMIFKEILETKDPEQRHQAVWYNPNAFTSLNPKLIDRSESGNELYLIENTELNEIYNESKMWFLRFREKGKLPPESRRLEEIDPQYAESNPYADAIQKYHCEFLEIHTMTYAEERQYWRNKT